MRRKDGTCFDGEITARAVSFASSPGIQVWVRDITERKAVQEALRHSEEKYRMIFRYSPVGILHFDETGTITDLNDKCVKMIGSSRDRLIGLNMLSQLQDWKIKECVKKALCGHVAYFEGTYSSVTAEKLTPISSYFGPVVNEKNLPIGGVGIVEDLTDRIRAEQELRDSEERFRTLVQNLMDPVLIMDFDGSIHFANDAAFELFGVPSDQDVSSIGIESFLSPENYDKVLADLSTVRSTGGPLITEYPITTSFGEERWIEASGHLTLWHGEPKDIISLRDITERKFTENAIRQSEERYRSLYRMVRLMCDNVPDLIWAKDLDRRFIFTNRAICDRLLCADSTDEPVGKTDMFFAERERTAQPENPEWHTFGGICLDSDSIVMNTGQTQRFDEFGNVRGEFLHLDVHKAPLRNEKGEMIGTVGCGRDVTKERAIEEALRESEYRYRDLFDKAIDLIYTHDLDGNYMSCNAAVNALFGYTPEEFLKMNFREILHPDHLEVAMQNMVKKIDGTMDTTGPYEVLIKTKTGISKWVEVVSRTIREGGKPVSVHGICRDITDRKLAEQELAEAKHYLDRIINSIADPVFVKNENHQWVLLNEAYCNFMGYSAKELLGKSDYDFFPTNEADIFWKKDEEVFSSGRENINQEQFTDKDGTTHTIVTKKTLCVDPGGRKYLVGVIRDITEIIQFHEERRNLESQLRHAHRMEAIGTLAGGIAHDFNNLLQVTLGYSEFLISQKSKDHPDYPDLQKINQAALSGAELVKGLLTFSRKVESKPEILNLNAGIIHIEQLLRRTMPKMISIRFNLAGDLMQISADPVQIEQILMNLAINSRDAISESGSITISTRNVQPSDDLFRIHPETMCQDFVEMAVSDDGSGMDQETIDHIFDPFYTTKEVGRGTGLGLAMVYGIVKQHSGYILCRSEIGKGTIFRIYFPAIPSTKIVDVNTSGEMPIMGTETILLVEDEFLVRELGERTLRGHGYEVLTATNGQEALEIFVRLRDRISLIILDMIMPTMSGRDCLKKILEIDPNARVIIASGHSAETSLAECIELGAKEFIPKPFRFTKLLKLIRTILDEE